MSVFAQRSRLWVLRFFRLLLNVSFAAGWAVSALAAGPALLPLIAPPNETVRLQSESLRLASGGELVTFFEPLPENSPASAGRRKLPLVSVLKDTLDDSDPGNDRLRQVWVFTYSRPSIWQRVAGGIPFLYHRAGLDRGTGSHPPKAVVDLGDPAHGVWAGLGYMAVQSEVLNPIGALARLTTHSFFGNYGEYRQTHVWEASVAISSLPPDSFDTNSAGLTNEELNAVEERLELTGRPLGGLVSDDYLPRAYEKQRARQSETRGHNWELLRQRAEETGLYVQPLDSSAPGASFAMLWVAQKDLNGTAASGFAGQFLGIANPFMDERLRHWTGYTETWYLDQDGAVVSSDEFTPGAEPVRMIPLALYALDHPRVPLLVVDFRRPGPRRREMALKFAEDATSGVLGLTTYGNLGYAAAKSSFLFIHARHGGATNRAARRRAFVEVRHALGTDLDIRPDLRQELLSRVEKIDVNPIERPWQQEIRDAWQQYDALIAYAGRTELAREINGDRNQELRVLQHDMAKRALIRFASIGTCGLYRHQEKITATTTAQIDQQRRLQVAKTPTTSLPPMEVNFATDSADGGKAQPADASVVSGSGAGAGQ